MSEEIEASTRDLLEDVGMLSPDGQTRRSDPLRDPRAFVKLAELLHRAVTEPYDFIVVRDLFGDRVLGYQFSLISGKPVRVSYDTEGIIALDDDEPVEEGSQALILADTHFTPYSIQAAASRVQMANAEVMGAAMLLQVREGNFPFPVWALESLA